MTDIRIRLKETARPRGAPAVLWAEDNEHDELLIREAVRDLDANITFASDGLHALDAVRRERPTLLVLDLRMPRMGGLEALRQIRADPALRGLRVCIFSAGNQPDEVAACRALGALAVVQKPVDFDAFERAVREVLQHARPVAVA